MARRVTSGAKVSGLKELDAALLDLGKAGARNVLIRSLKPRGQVVADAMKANAPVNLGDLRDGIGVSVKKPAKMDPGKQAYAQAMKSSGGDKGQAVKAMREARRANPSNFAVVYVGVGGNRKPIAHIAEWGSSKQVGTRFATRAWDAEGPGLLDGVQDDIMSEIDKAKARAARKAARLLAKAGA